MMSFPKNMTLIQLVNTLPKNHQARIEFYKMKSDAYYMRTAIHEQGLRDWNPKQRRIMESILYDSETNKLKR